jgi:hypothetical protein
MGKSTKNKQPSKFAFLVEDDEALAMKLPVGSEAMRTFAKRYVRSLMKSLVPVDYRTEVHYFGDLVSEGAMFHKPAGMAMLTDDLWESKDEPIPSA